MKLTLDDIRHLLRDQLAALATEEPREVTRVRVRLTLIISLLERRLGLSDSYGANGGLIESLDRTRHEVMGQQDIELRRLRALVQEVLAGISHITRDPDEDGASHPSQPDDAP